MISFKAEIYPISNLIAEGFHTKMSAISQGYEYYLVSEDETVIRIDKEEGIRTLLEKINRRLSAGYKYYLGDEAGALASALALGNQNDVPDEMGKAFRRSGLAHILALSGSHIILIIGTFDKLLFAGLFLGKRMRSAVMLLTVPLYVMLVMSPVPVIRAGLMYMIGCFAVLLGRESDSITALFLSVLLMVAAQPYLIFSVSLWMSFLATLALIVFMPIINKRLNAIKKKTKHPRLFAAFSALFLSVSMCILGTCANLIFSYGTFGMLSTVSLPANIIFGPILTVLLAAYMLFLPLLPFPDIARIVAFPIKWASEKTVDLIEYFSSFKYSVVSLTGDVAAFACIGIFVICCLLLVVKLKKKGTVLFAMILLLSVFTGSVIYRATEISADVDCLPRSKNEMVIVRVGDDYSLIDASDGYLSNFSYALKEAKADGACELRTVVLTHYHRNHVNALMKLFEREVVRGLVVPEPISDIDIEVFERLLKLCEKKNVPITVSAEGVKTEINEESFISFSSREFLERSTHPLVSYTLNVCDKEIVYIGASNGEGVDFETLKKRAENSDYTVIGRHGPVPKRRESYSFSERTLLFILNEDMAKFVEIGNFGAPMEDILRPNGAKIKIR